MKKLISFTILALVLTVTSCQKETIVLVQTDQNSVIGGYCPDQWESTNDMENSEGEYYCKDIVSGKPFLFYWVGN